MEATQRWAAILLCGPTGSGKTPLGDYLETHGLWGRSCAHFDFGAHLRSAARSAEPVAGLDERDLDVVRESLRTGALLENENFPIAWKILDFFVRRSGLTRDGFLILNGLPRHAGQARDLDAFVKVREVVYLDCTPEVVHQRIRLNSGGDRTGRVDDGLDAVGHKLVLFRQRTLPLLEHYRAAGARVLTFTVQPATRPEDVWDWLMARQPPIAG